MAIIFWKWRKKTATKADDQALEDLYQISLDWKLSGETAVLSFDFLDAFYRTAKRQGQRQEAAWAKRKEKQVEKAWERAEDNFRDTVLAVLSD